jgi:peptidoglycan hydrolase CwlO-like protein
MRRVMVPHQTRNGRSWRIGVWSSSLFAAVLLLVFLCFLPLASPVLGDTQSDALKRQLSQKQTALDQAYSQLQALQEELGRLGEGLNTAAVRLGELDLEINEVGNDITKADHDLDLVRAQLEQRLVSLYKDGSAWSSLYLEVLFTETDLVSVLERFDILAKIADQDQKLFADVKGYAEASRADRTLLEGKRAEQKSQLEQLTQVQEQMSAKRAEFATRYQSLKGQIADLAEEIRKASALEDAARAAAAAQARALDEAATAASAAVQPTTPTTAPAITPAAKPDEGSAPPTSAAQIKAQADFIYKTFLVPRKSVLTGQMIMDVWAKYGISPAASMTVLNAETGMGSLRSGGLLVPANNFGCIKYRDDPVWLRTPPPPITYGRIEVAGYSWFTFASPAEGMDAWGRAITHGLGRDCYRPLMKAGDWAAFADIYYGKNVPGKAEYVASLQRTYGMIMTAARAAGYNW